MVQQTSIPCQLFYGWGLTPHVILSIVGAEPGETPSALSCLSFLINRFLTDIKHLARN